MPTVTGPDGNARLSGSDDGAAGGADVAPGGVETGGVAGAGPALDAGGVPVPETGGSAEGNAGGGIAGAEPRPRAHVHVTVATASPGCRGPTNAFASVVFDPVSCVCEVEASIFGNCHSYTVISRRCDACETPLWMN